MKIRFYGYNAFLIESGNKKIAIDPGALFFYWFRVTTLIPKSEWQGLTHIFIKHGGLDHYWHADRLAKASNAAVICNKTMVKSVDGKTLALGPHDKGLSFTTKFNQLHTLSVDETIRVDGISIAGIKATHGELTLRVGPFSKMLIPGPHERIDWGAIGFDIQVNSKNIVNLGDTLLHEKEWQSIQHPDVLMIPIGGMAIHNTMDAEEALQAINIMRPKLVIPCQYNCPAFFTKTYNPADDVLFKTKVEKIGVKCKILAMGDAIESGDE